MNDWQFITGCNFTFKDNVYISQPTMKELATAFPDENDFLKVIQMVNHTKESLKQQIGQDIPVESNYFVLLSLLKMDMTNGDAKMEQLLLKFFRLLFKDFIVEFSSSGISISTKEEDVFIFVDEHNYDNFQKIIRRIFCLSDLFGNQEIITDYNPQSDRAKRIADQLKKRHDTLAKMEKESSGKSVFANYIDIVSVGLGVSVNEISNYTLYQLMRAMQRLNLLEAFIIDLKVRLAGGDPKEETEHWKKIM